MAPLLLATSPPCPQKLRLGPASQVPACRIPNPLKNRISHPALTQPHLQQRRGRAQGTATGPGRAAGARGAGGHSNPFTPGTPPPMPQSQEGRCCGFAPNLGEMGGKKNLKKASPFRDKRAEGSGVGSACKSYRGTPGPCWHREPAACERQHRQPHIWKGFRGEGRIKPLCTPPSSPSHPGEALGRAGEPPALNHPWEGHGFPASRVPGSASGNIRHHPPPAPPFPAKILTDRRNPERKLRGAPPTQAGFHRCPGTPVEPPKKTTVVPQSPSWEDGAAWGCSPPPGRGCGVPSPHTGAKAVWGHPSLGEKMGGSTVGGED